MTFAALSGVIVLFILFRNVPHHRSIILSTLALGSTAVAVIHYIFGTWLPSLEQLARNPLVIAITILSGLTGMGITYYYNDTTNMKINTMLRVALQLVGLALMGGSASTFESGALVVASVVIGRFLPLILQERNVLRALRRAKTAVQHDLRESIPSTAEEFTTTEEIQVSPLTPVPVVQQVEPTELLATAAAAAVMAAGVAPAPVSPLVERGLILNVETGKTIQIGKMTYLKKVHDGYVVDLTAGTITPPPKTGGSSGEQSPRRGRGTTGGSGSQPSGSTQWIRQRSGSQGGPRR